jgi:hypothetical protein
VLGEHNKGRANVYRAGQLVTSTGIGRGGEVRLMIVVARTPTTRTSELGSYGWRPVRVRRHP